MPVDTELVLQKCKRMLADLERLQRLLKEQPYEALVTGSDSSTIAERLLERLVNRAIDVNFHLIREYGKPPPDDYTQSFTTLAELGVLAPGLAHDLAPSAGARNILVHEYDDLDTQKFYASLQAAARLFPAYVKAVAEHAQRASSKKTVGGEAEKKLP